MGRLLTSEQGQAAVEYAVLGVLISVVAITYMTGIGLKVAQFFSDLLSLLP